MLRQDTERRQRRSRRFNPVQPRAGGRDENVGRLRRRHGHRGGQGDAGEHDE